MVTKSDVGRRVWFSHCGRVEGTLRAVEDRPPPGRTRAVVESDDLHHGGTWEMSPEQVFLVPRPGDVLAAERERIVGKLRKVGEKRKTISIEAAIQLVLDLS